MDTPLILVQQGKTSIIWSCMKAGPKYIWYSRNIEEEEVDMRDDIISVFNSLF
jgi:hypothetical protein